MGTNKARWLFRRSVGRSSLNLLLITKRAPCSKSRPYFRRRDVYVKYANEQEERRKTFSHFRALTGSKMETNWMAKRPETRKIENYSLFVSLVRKLFSSSRKCRCQYRVASEFDLRFPVWHTQEKEILDFWATFFQLKMNRKRFLLLFVRCVVS